MTDPQDEVERLLGEFLAAGASRDPEAFLARHPEHADALRRHLVFLDVLDDAFRVSAAPDRLGIYRIEAELGSGGMGTVYRAVAEQDGAAGPAGTTVAVKLMHPHLFRARNFFKRFLREGELGRRIAHPNVVRTWDVDAVEVRGRTQHFLVMEYVEGQTLRDLLDDLQRVPEELARTLGLEICAALSAIHAAGAVHRDLKPENVLLTPEQQVKVMDLGVAQLVDESVRLSQTGAFVGSMLYAAPEQFQGRRDLDARADLHGLGLLLYELTSGTNPFADEDAHVAMRRILDEAPRRLGQLNPQLSAFFEEVVHRLLAKDPGERFASADEVRAVLEAGEGSAWWTRRAQALRQETQRPLRRIRVPRETALFGREADLADLARRFERVKAGAGQVVLLEGEAGVGKTRLVDEFVAQLQADGEEVDFLFGSHPPGGAATATGALGAAFREHVGDDALEATLGRALEEMPALVPGFAALLRGEVAPEGARPLGRESVQTAFVRVARTLAARRPTVVLVDDLHFAPDGALALFAALTAAVPEDRILLVGSFRPGLSETWLSELDRLEHCHRHVLGRLSPKDLVALLKEAFGSERLARELGGLVAEKSDGNPFFAFEILDELRGRGAVRQSADGTWERTRPVRDLEVPSSVEGLVLARMEGLEEPDRILLDLAACCGYRFDPLLVAEATGEGRIPALRRLARLESRHKLVRSVGAEYAFDHHLVQEVLYAALPAPLRAEYHALVAETLEARIAQRGPDGAAAFELARHHLAGGRGERALPHLHAGFMHLLGRVEHDAAVDLARSALDAPGLLEGEARAALLLRVGHPLDALDRVGEALEAAEEAWALAEREGLDRVACSAAARTAHYLQRLDRYADAEAWLQRARDLMEKTGDTREQVGVTNLLGRGLQAAGRFDEAIRLFQEALDAVAEEAPSPRRAQLCHSLGQVLATRGRQEEGLALGARALDEASALGDHGAIGLASMLLGNLNLHRGACDVARTHFERAVSAGRSLGSPLQAGSALRYLGWLAEVEGNLDEAVRLLDEAWRNHRDAGFDFETANTLSSLGLVELSSGLVGAAERHLAEALRLWLRGRHPASEAIARVNLGLIALVTGRYEEADEQLGEALALTRAGGERRTEGYALERLGRSALQQGDLEAARLHLEACCALREEIGDLLDLGFTWIHLGTVLRRQGEEDAGRASFERAIELAGRVARPAVAALARCHLLEAGGDATEAEEAVAAAGERLGCFERMEAHHLLWKATGCRPHQVEAKRLLDHVAEHTEEAHRAALLENVALHREILAGALGC